MCRIKLGKKVVSGWGSGFYCLIPLPNTAYKIPVLITSEHVLGREYLEIGKQIEIEIDNYDRSFIISISKESQIFTNRELDITIIKINKENKLFNNVVFIDIDENIYKNEEFLQKYLHKKRAYILEYTKGIDYYEHDCEKKKKCSTKEILKELTENKEFSIEEGEINYDGKMIIHNIPTGPGASGGPIISDDKFKVIGYHLGKNRFMKEGIGKLLKYPIQEFIRKFYS